MYMEMHTRPDPSSTSTLKATNTKVTQFLLVGQSGGLLCLQTTETCHHGLLAFTLNRITATSGGTFEAKRGVTRYPLFLLINVRKTKLY